MKIGKVTRAVGIAGWIGIMPDDPASETLLKVREVWLGSRRYEVVRSERRGRGVALELSGVRTRTEAEAFRGLEVAVEREALPALEDGEFYATELIGFVLRDRVRGEVVGTVAGVASMGGQDLLMVEREGREILVPLAYEPEVDRAAGEVRMSLPEGLLEL